VGTVFTTPSKTLTDAHFLFFAGLTGDNHPIHYDVEYARATRFGKPLAHGLLLAALTALGASSAMHRISGFVFVEQGSRFLRPVLVGDTITPRLVVEKVWTDGTRRFVRFATTLTNQRGETVLEGFHVYRVVASAAPAADGA
jgi:acyl dehydratase